MEEGSRREEYAEAFLLELLTSDAAQQVYQEYANKKVKSETRSGKREKSSSSGWKMFFGLVTMVLFVLFCAGYEGARRYVLAQDREKVVKIERLAEKVEGVAGGNKDAMNGKVDMWRVKAMQGDRSARQALGLLMLSGRGGVENPFSEPVMARTWSLFGFSLFFGLAVVGYYIIRPLYFAFHKKSGCSSLIFMVMIFVSFYFPGLIVFHYSRLLYPAFSAWIAKYVSLVF